MRQALENVGHHVIPLQENTERTWQGLQRAGEYRLADLVLWTRTGWDWPRHTGWTWEQATDEQLAALDALHAAGLPVVGYHLDRWWGLDREGQVYDEPFFQADLVVTADGGHDAEWAGVGVAHAWLPPGVLAAECLREPRIRRQYRHDVTFVGSWRLGVGADGHWSGYHAEWAPYRKAMLDTLTRRFGRRFVAYPRRGGLRGAELTDLYGNAKVVVGDSCLAPADNPPARYWSDRIPETVGRGGLLVHPHVEGLEEHYTPGEHLATFPLGDHEAMVATVQRYLADDPERTRMRKAGREHVLAQHTYEVRVGQLVALCAERGLL